MPGQPPTPLRSVPNHHDTQFTPPLDSQPASPAPSKPDPLAAFLPPSVIAFVHTNLGLLYVGLAQLFFALMNLTVKYFLTSTDVSVLALIGVRMFITAAACMLVLYFMGDPNYLLGPPEIRRLLCVRGFFGFTGLFGAYQSYKGLSISDAVTISFLGPTVVALLGYFYLHESLSRKELGAGVCSLFGVMLVSRPPFIFGEKGADIEVPDAPLPGGGQEGTSREERMASVAWAFGTVFTASIAYITIRAIGNRAHALHSLEYFAYLCTLVCFLGLIILPGESINIKTLHDFVLIMIIGIFGFIAQTLLTLGLQREKAGRAALATYLSVFFTLILEFFAFGTFPSFLSVIGTSIILSAAIWVAISGSAAPPVQDDPESQPVSRSPSPIPPPSTGRTLRGELYSYASISSGDDEQRDEAGLLSPPKVSRTLSDQLKVKGYPGRRRHSGASLTLRDGTGRAD